MLASCACDNSEVRIAAPPKEAASLVYSTEALKHRGTKAGLSAEKVEAIIDNNVRSLA